MSQWDIRRNPSLARRSIGSLLRRNGRVAEAPGTGRHRMSEMIEALENRVMLAGDEPNFAQVFNTPAPLTPPEIVLDAQGVGVSVTGAGSSAIGIGGDDDVFRFTAPANDFVRIWGDALSTLSPLDSRVEVYTGTVGGNATLIASGSNQGVLTTGSLPDGWAGFKAIAGQEYFVVVKSDRLSGPGSIGDYTLRIAAKSQAFPPPTTPSGQSTINGTITRPGSDVVYRLVMPSNALFNGLMIVQAEAVPADLDTRVDVYDSTGTLIRGDSDSGSQTDSYMRMVSQANATYYIRVRSDEFGDPILRPSTGAFTVVVDGIPDVIPIDPVTRLSPVVGGGLADNKEAHLYSFTAQGTGLSFISLAPAGLPPIPDSFLHLYNEAGTEIGTNELPGPTSRMLIQLTGGVRYFLVVEAFDSLGGGGGFSVQVEAHHNYDQAESIPMDDHINLPTVPGDATWELATPIVWGAPVLASTLIPGLNPAPPDPGADHVKVVLGKATGRIHTAADTDLFQFVPPVDMLGMYAGADNSTAVPPPQSADWQLKQRPATRLQVIARSEGAFMTDATIRIYDSNFQLIYGPNDRVITTAQGNNISGGLDPASWPPVLRNPPYPYTFFGGQPISLTLDFWGGEVYYLAVSSGGGSGRYTVTLQADAPVDTAGIDQFFPTIPNSGQFSSAWEVRLDANTGEGRNYSGAAGGAIIDNGDGTFTAAAGAAPNLLGQAFAMNLLLPTPPPAGAGATFNNFNVNPGSRGRGLLRLSDFGNLTSPTDSDLYQFRAIYSGTVEIRVNTTNLADEFFEGSVDTEDGDPMTPPVQTVLARKTKTYNSPLDGALRIFDNDQTQIYYNNDNGVTGGNSDTTNAGALNGYTFQRRDPRAVITVEAGKTYYIQVESGQRSNFSLTFPKVDWRHATGSYELLVNSMPNLNFADDHANAGPVAQATPVPVDLSITSFTAALGSVNGQIANVAIANPDDTDMFTFISPGDGTAVFKLALRSANAQPPIPFARRFSLFDVNGALLGTQTSSGSADQTISVAARQGDRFFMVVDGDEAAGGTFQGLYTVSVSGVPFQDDYASEDDYLNAFVIDKDLYDYDGTETLNGVINTAGDTDVFTFQSLAFDIATVSVTGASGFSPTVKIYEISVDPAGNPIRLLIANNSAGVGGATAQISFSLTAPPRTTGTESYPNYFIVVGGLSPDTSKGAYTLTLSINNTTDDHPDGPNPPPPGVPNTPGQWSLATVITAGPTGNGGSSGVIELQGDTDLFTFTSPAQGLVFVSVVSPTSSRLLPRLRIIDENFNPVTDIATSQIFLTGADISNSVATFSFLGTRDAKYFIMIEGVIGAGNTFKTDDIGAYFVTITVPVPDDHPNTGEFPIATNIVLSQFTGDGSDTGLISPATDTDLFTFTAILSGNMVVTVSTPGSGINPGLRLYAPNQTEIGTLVLDGGFGDDDGAVNGSVTRHFSITQGSQYWVLVSTDQTSGQTTGSYVIDLDGPAPTTLPDDHANAGDWNNASIIPLDQTTGDGTGTGNIETPGDTDLFYFTSLAGSPTRPLQAFIQVVTPAGQLLDVGVRIIRQDRTTIVATDTGGGPGYNAGVEFPITATGERYYVEVDGLGTLTGSYIVRVDTSPESYFLYYPDGKITAGTREFVSFGNSNNFDVNYTMTIRYEDSALPDVTVTGVAVANKRSGLTIADGNGFSRATLNKPYSIIIESDGFLGASISHYDVNATLGEAFTGRSSTFWSFARADKSPGGIQDQLVTYNPNAGAARVTLTTYQPNGTAAVIIQTVPGFSRLTWDFNTLAGVPIGQFAFTVSSVPVVNGAPHTGIVASLNHFDISNSDGYAVLGDSAGGATTGILPGLVDSGNLAPSQFSSVTIFNTSNAVANINLVGRYQSTSIPDLIRPITLNPHESLTLTGTQLGLVANQTIGIRYDSNVAVTVLESTRRFGDSDATQGQSQAGTSWFFGDAFINRARAGQLYFENMYFYNPATTDISVQLHFIFNQGADSFYTFNVPARNFGAVALHQLAAVLGHAVFNYFSIVASSAAPFVVSMTHYDLVLAGGWGSEGAPLGLTNPVNTIP